MAQIPKLDQPATYRIQFAGRLAVDWSDWLSNLTVTVQGGDEQHISLTTLCGTVRDQPALFGLLAHIRDLGLPLMLVQYLEPIA